MYIKIRAEQQEVFRIFNAIICWTHGDILVGEWQIALLVHFRRVMECSCKSTLKICRLEFYLTSFTNSKLFLPFTVERKVFDCSKH